MKNVWTWIGVICLIAGTVIACFFDLANDVPGLAIAAFGLGALVIQTWKKAEKKNIWVLISIILVCIGGFCCAIAGLSQDVMTKTIAAVVAVVSILIGLLIPAITKKAKE